MIGKTSSLPDAAKLRIHKRANLFLALIPLAFAAGLAMGYLFWGAQQPAYPQAEAIETGPQVTQEVKRYDIPVDDDPIFGPENAPITIVEFSDFECPFCTKWHVEVWPRLQEAFPGQVRLVYRDFPLADMHGNASQAAEAANCAGEQDQYWQYHDLLFKAEEGLGEKAFIKYANDLGLDQNDFTECLESRRYQDEVQADLLFASDLGVRSTPTFFINGIALVGAQPFEVFQDVITKELAGELPE